jgi:hypothetical protein
MREEAWMVSEGVQMISLLVGMFRPYKEFPVWMILSIIESMVGILLWTGAGKHKHKESK